jgi:carbon monoxide dehydrogenase subunit G
MPFQIDKTFIVRAPAPAVWDFLTDPQRVARCMPGAAITDQVDDRTWGGTLTVKVGPVSASYKGRMSFARLDAQARSAEIVASGQDVRGKGGATMRLQSRLSERAPGETEVAASTELNVTGILAQMGRGMIQDVGDQIFEKFTGAMRAELEASARPPAAAPSAGSLSSSPPPPASLDVLSLGAGAAARAAGRSLRRPQLWIALAVFALLAFWLLVRSRS